MSHQIHQDERIKVAIRIRPPIGREEEHENAITVLDVCLEILDFEFHL